MNDEEEIVGKYGYVKDGYYAGLVGVISEYEDEYLSGLYKITPKGFGGVVTSRKRIVLVDKKTVDKE